MGKRLLDKVAELKSKWYKVGRKNYKSVGGAGGLTKKAIKVIQGHYGHQHVETRPEHVPNKCLKENVALTSV